MAHSHGAAFDHHALSFIAERAGYPELVTGPVLLSNDKLRDAGRSSVAVSL